MSGVIHFVSGKTLEISQAEFDQISPKLNARGVKISVTTDGHKIPLNSTTMEFIEHVPEVVEEPEVVEPEVIETEYVKVEEVVDNPRELVEKEKPKTQEEKLVEMMEKSACKHEPEKMVLYKQQTAKGERLFPVCSFCGKRERYVSEKRIIDGKYEGTPNEKWTEEDVANARPWIEA